MSKETFHSIVDERRKMDEYLSEIKKTGLSRWSNMPVKVYIEPTSNASGFKPHYVDILRKAWNDWAHACSSAISVKFVSNINRACVVCKWTDKTTDMVNRDMFGSTALYVRFSGLADAEMKILTVAPRGNFIVTDNFMHRIALHEVGHALGLGGHSDRSTDIMYGISDAHDRRGALSNRDINTVLALYGLEQAEFDKHKLNPLNAGNYAANSVALRLNGEALLALEKGDFVTAITKLEAAHKLEPANLYIKKNLSLAYCNGGANALMTANINSAAFFFTRAIPFLAEKKKH